MNDLQRDFLRQSVFDLENLREKLSVENFSENFARFAFRLIHTIKGTAQTFGFDEAALLAHELENLLQTVRESKADDDGSLILLLREGVVLLIENMRAASGEKQVEHSQDFVEKIKQITKADSPAKKFTLRLPPDVLSQLSRREKNLLGAALENGLDAVLIEVGFAFANFDADFKKFGSVLAQNGESVAAFPSRKFSDRLGFQFFFITEKTVGEISQIIAPFGAEIIYRAERQQPIYAGNNLEDALRQAIDGAEKLAKRMGKKVSFDISPSCAEAEVPAKYLKIIFDILLHLTRNAIDHAIEKEGKISVFLNEEENGLRLTFSDNGKGVDTEKVRAKAVENKLISAEKTLTEAEILDLIFLPEITTASDITEVSGRGVGLDAVKSAAENAGGAISVKSKRDFGTTFEVILPYEK